MIRKIMKTLKTMACAIAFAVPHLVSAQATPAETQAATPAAAQLNFRSAFSDYKPYEDVPVADWRQVNDNVQQAATKSGGHAGHDVQKPAAEERTAPGDASADSPTPPQKHMGHGMHGGAK
jgi:hypothetical protein